MKNQAALLEALGELLPVHGNIRVAIVGDGPERPALVQQIRSRGLDRTAALLGNRDDVSDLLSMFDVFVLSSIGEGLCNTILEAMAVGLPVVATAVGGNPELVEDGVTGLLVPAADAGALARAVERYAIDEQLRRDHGTAGRRRVLQQFTLDRMVERYVALYESELKRKRCAE